MKAQIKRMIAVFGGSAAIALALGLGGIDVSRADGASTAADQTTSSVTPAQGAAAGSGVHLATLAGCIAGANC